MPWKYGRRYISKERKGGRDGEEEGRKILNFIVKNSSVCIVYRDACFKKCPKGLDRLNICRVFTQYAYASSNQISCFTITFLSILSKLSFRCLTLSTRKTRLQTVKSYTKCRNIFDILSWKMDDQVCCFLLVTFEIIVYIFLQNIVLRVLFLGIINYCIFWLILIAHSLMSPMLILL